MKTVTIVEGWTEGPATFKKFRSCLEQAGFKISKSAKNCDILITHSAGSFFIPTDFSGELIMMINPAFGLSKPKALRQFRGLALDAPEQIRQWGLTTWLKQRLLNAFYFLAQLPRTILIVKLMKRDEIKLPKNAKVILLHNQGDVDHSPTFKRMQQITPSARLVELPGLHEDCLINPQPYVDLLLKEL